MSIHANSRDWQTRIRLWAAILMGVYFLIRMGYYSMGLISGEAMETYLAAFSVLWVFTPAFMAVVVVHMGLGLWKIFQRNTLKMPIWEWAQILFGLALPYFLFPYMVITAISGVVFHLEFNYVDSILLTYPEIAWSYVCVALIIGIHGNIGTHAVLRIRPWYPRVKPIIFFVLMLTPLTAALGYLNGGNTLYTEWKAGKLPLEDLPHPLGPAEWSFVSSAETAIYFALTVLYAVVFAARKIRVTAMEKKKTIRVLYPSGQSVAVFPGTTLLEASRIGDIAHASICGGRGRCTTCRVKVESGGENLSPIGERERKALLRIQAGAEVRLACQAQCLQQNIRITPLIRPQIDSKKARSETANSAGREVELSVMFTDLRGFTSLSEGKFPYDVVYILNSYFEKMGQAIESCGGKIDKFLGDGILAYFGFETDPRTGAFDSLRACVEMAHQLAEINERLKGVLEHPLSFGVGIHFGDAILGEIGYKDKSSLTIIGDTVNIASRLQTMTKETSSQLILSSGLAAQAGVDMTNFPLDHVTVRGKTEQLNVYVVKNLLDDLAPLLKK